jgi:hypothetical protein
VFKREPTTHGSDALIAPLLISRFTLAHPASGLFAAKGMAMKGAIAVAVAIAVLWVADVELNGGRYSDAILRAVRSLI